MITFLHNRKRTTLRDIDPDTTVLNWLRGPAGCPGTKEGCASGDCGACTVVVGEAQQGKMVWKTANSCLMLVSQLQGRQLITVEDLARGQQLHPAQQTLADHHGSQCGFCTPGIVMSMFALQKNAPGADRHAIEQHLGGNLCRCTGYRPIIEAAHALCQSPDNDQFQADSAAIAQQLAQITAEEQSATSELAGDGHHCLIPKNIADLARLYQQYPQAHLLAGGTDLALQITQFYRPLPLLISLNHVKELSTITVTDTMITLGATARLADIGRELQGDIPAFSEMLTRFASCQVRNQATLAGNLANASPIGDGAPMLLALGASLTLQCGEQQRELSLDDFFLDYRKTALAPGEFIRAIHIPRVTVSPSFQAWKVSKRREDDISTVFGAFNLHHQQEVITSARVAFGGMAAVPARALACEAALCGKPLSETTLAAACSALDKDFSPLSDFRGTSGYRLQVAKNLLRRYFMSQLQGSDLVEVSQYVG
ncbi:xanthine dehydrogenase small subunit [Mangrovibacter plantisponsor]|uniref:Xanthine dehydrogenase small subunit n=1 Tax=Mangrovibacter plantisponsor TaxID=451513 RepID=A0A317Q4M9_9ENTR|nr:xanthine dehydrogenase small subunit [Mangrovibacter plantisponsor]PWW10969.1 xanthine dehydrogenase small subunit [Mangrovibacter plantisponsor]